MFVFKSKYNSKVEEVELLKKELMGIKSLYSDIKNKSSENPDMIEGQDVDLSLIIKEKDKNISVLKSVIEKLNSENFKKEIEILELRKSLNKQEEVSNQILQDLEKHSDSQKTEVNLVKEENIRHIFRRSYIEIKSLTKKLQDHYCNDDISVRTIERIFLYLEVLEESDENNFINSIELGHMADVKATTIRKDMTWLKINGVRGKGYSIKTLRKKLEKFIFIDGLSKKTIKKENTKLENKIELYKEIENITHEQWFSMSNWAKEKELFDGWIRKFLFTLGIYKMNNGRLTEKQIEGISKIYLEMKSMGFFELAEEFSKEVKSGKIENIEELKATGEEEFTLTFNYVLETGLKTGIIKGEILTKINYSIEKTVKDIYEAIEILEARGIQIK
ncbi:winged-helix domain-containing protein [uncultured Ilyobacter sp.]|uniref:winged-helix domain-containing protein n=1 Tax=uncultured Ilyobacter sp. TaxID=544433 RepID=UPI0029F58E13|nr:winged-helix domain-containing protein [uncultured Ilyobacter sp.]